VVSFPIVLLLPASGSSGAYGELCSKREWWEADEAGIASIEEKPCG